MKRFKVTSISGFSIGRTLAPRFQEKYLLEYKDETVVKKIKGSLGIFCFKTYEDALEFGTKQNINFLIKEVSTFSKALRKPNSICGNLSDIDWFYISNHKIHNFYNIPKGTVLYDKIEVIKTIATFYYRMGKTVKSEGE